MTGSQSYLGEKGEKGEPAVIEPVSKVLHLSVLIRLNLTGVYYQEELHQSLLCTMLKKLRFN